jgi:hypothetical protein
MSKITKKKITQKIFIASIVIGLAYFGFFALKTYAANLSAGDLSISFDGDQLFNELNIAPGFEKEKTITVTNNGSVPHSFGIAAANVSGELADVIMIQPRIGVNPLWTLSLAELANLPNGSQTIFSNIDPGSTMQANIVAFLPESVGNEYQGKSTSTFDFIVGPEVVEPSPSPTESPTSPSPSPTGTGGGGTTNLTGGAGLALGVSTSPSPSESVSPSPSPSGTVSGKKDEGTESKGTNYSFLYWLIPLLVILLILFFLWWRRRRRDEDEEEDLGEEI